MLDTQNRSELLNTIVNKISEVMAIMNMFEDSRPGSIAFERLEESIMWLQVMAHNVQLKPEEKKDEEIIPTVRCIDTEE